jgi:hypothetical protein
MPRALGLDSGSLDWSDLYRNLKAVGIDLERTRSHESALDVLSGPEPVDLLLVMDPAPPVGQLKELMQSREDQPELFLFLPEAPPQDLEGSLEALGAWVFIRPWADVLLRRALTVAGERAQLGSGGRFHLVDDRWFDVLRRLQRRDS